MEGTRRLVDARASAVRHFVYVSIVGIDQIPLGYYRRKLAAEGIVAGGGTPYSILRATQFHTLVDAMLSAVARIPLAMPLPTDFRFQSVDPGEVAERLARAVDAGPGERLPDFGGPEVTTLAEAAEHWKRARGVGRRVVRLPLPGGVAAGFRAARNTAPQGERGVLRWQDWLRGQSRPAGEPASRTQA